MRHGCNMKIPPKAKRVFKGEIFEVYQWNQKMFDGYTKIFEMLKRPNTLQVIATVGSKIIFAWEQQPTKPPYYGLLGGRQNKRENPLAGAKRELLEESGMVSEDWELLKIYRPVSKIEWEVHLFVARNCKKIQEPKLDPGERIKLKKSSLREFVSIAQSDDFFGSELSLDLLRMQKDKVAWKAFKKKLFPNVL